jgi:hypothetical protein
VLLLDETAYPLETDTLNVKNWRYFSPAYWRLAWLDYHLGLAKRRHEQAKGIRYDNVVFIRTDCWYFQVGNADNATKQLHTMAVSHIGQSGVGTPNDLRNDDLVWRAGSSAADLMCLRWLDPYYDLRAANQLVHGDSHVLLAAYVTRNFIAHDPETAGFRCTLIRPDHVDHMPWSWEKHDDSHNDSFTWHHRTDQEKTEYCKRLGIDPRDYQLAD